MPQEQLLTMLCMTQDAAFDPEASSSAEEILCGDSRCECGNPTCSCGPQGQCQYVRNYGKHDHNPLSHGMRFPPFFTRGVYPVHPWCRGRQSIQCSYLPYRQYWSYGTEQRKHTNVLHTQPKFSLYTKPLSHSVLVTCNSL